MTLTDTNLRYLLAIYHLAKTMPELSRPITREEYDEVVDHLFALGMENGYVQELESASPQYIPPFDLTGVE